MKGDVVVHVTGPGALAHTPAALLVPALAGAGLVAAATVAGAWLARRRPGHREIWFGAAAGALLVIAGLHLLPDAWSAARAVRIWPGLVLVAAAAAFTAAGLATRLGCACQEHQNQASGGSTAVALTVHRFLEGSAIVLAGSAAVAVALTMHAFGEGLATGALLGAQPRRVAGWLTAMSVSPLFGAATKAASPHRPSGPRTSCFPRCGHWRSSSASAPTTTAGTAGPDQRAEATQNYPATGWRRGHPGRSRPAGPAPTRSSPLTWPPSDHDGTPGKATKTGTPAP
jgi:zinc transporter ZupT